MVEPSLKPEDVNITMFQSMSENRFLVKWDVIPSYLINKVTLPEYRNGYWGNIELIVYNSIMPSTFKSLFSLIDRNDSKEPIEFDIEFLGPVGDVVSIWVILVDTMYIDFGQLNWTVDKAEPYTTTISIQPRKVKLLF